MYLNWLRKLWEPTSPTQIILKGISVAFGAFGTFLLGSFSVIPRPFWGTFDEGTVLFLAGSSTLIATVTWASFQLSRPFILSTYHFGLFIYCKFILGPRYPRGLRNPKVSNYQDYKFRRLLNSSIGRLRILLAQLVLTLALLWNLYFSSAVAGDLDYLLDLLVAVMVYAFALMAAHGVFSDISLRNFLITNQGLGLLTSSAFIFCFAAGSLRVSDMMNRSPLSLNSGDLSCLITPLLPVSSGELVFFQETRSFVIIRNDGSLLTLQSEDNLEQLIPCWKK